MHIDLVDLRAISQRSGTPINAVSAWTRDPQFPEPTASLSIGDVWVWGTVRHWLKTAQHPTDFDLTGRRH
jgi:hypothetical protein